MLRHAGQRAVLRVPVAEEKEAGERRLRLARQQPAQQADQLRVALLLGGPPRHGDLEGVRVVAQHQQLVPAAKRHAGGHVEAPAHVAAGVVSLMLLLINLQQDVAPRGRQGKVREGVRRLRLQPTAPEGQVVLVLEGDLRFAERLVRLKLLTLGYRARVVAVLAAHMPEERLSAAETVALPRADFDFTNEVVALCTVVAYALVSTNGSTAAVAAVVAPPSVRAVGRTAAVPAVAPQTRVLAVRRASTVPAVGAHRCRLARLALALGTSRHRRACFLSK